MALTKFKDQFVDTSKIYQYDGYWFPVSVKETTLNKIKETSFSAQDVFVATYPKSGTTWMQEMLYLIMTNADVKSAADTTLSKRVPFLDAVFPGEPPNKFDAILNSPSPRLLKTHLNSSWYDKAMQTEKPRFIVVYRNPKDCLVSYFYQYKDKLNYEGKFGDFFEMYKNKELFYGDPFEHLLSWWKFKDENNVLITTYEEMQHDVRSIIKKVATFLNKELSEEAIDQIIAHTSFEYMKTNQMIKIADKIPSGSMMRRGIIGDWKNYFSEEQSSFIDSRQKEVTKEYGIPFYYE